jgi:nuclear pore complex protein Nup107
MSSSDVLSELVVIREWLHDTAPSPRDPDASNGYRVFTRLRLAQTRRTGVSAPPEGLVTGLDPDAPNKENGKALAMEDTVSRHSFARPRQL